ncbi:MAG: hypothetical protein EXR62_10105 [Chloroflexi bacterium]|nr:hypothetical protein [Chloroflexota bacterium]
MPIRAELTITDPYEAFAVIEGQIEGPIEPQLSLKMFPTIMHDLMAIMRGLAHESPLGTSERSGLLSILKGVTAPGYLFKASDGRSLMIYPRHVGSSFRDLSKGNEITVNIFDSKGTKGIGIGVVQVFSS